MSGLIFIDFPDDEPDTTGLDRRTRRGREEEVLRKVRRDGGFSVFWATENQKRACASTRLEETGRIRRCKDPGSFPNCRYEIVGG